MLHMIYPTSDGGSLGHVTVEPGIGAVIRLETVQRWSEIEFGLRSEAIGLAATSGEKLAFAASICEARARAYMLSSLAATAAGTDLP